MDVSASIINLVAIRYAMAPADAAEHRLGHGKAESWRLVQSAFLISGSALLLMMHGIVDAE